MVMFGSGRLGFETWYLNLVVDWRRRRSKGDLNVYRGLQGCYGVSL